MQPGKYDLSLYRGDTYSWTFRLWSDAAKTQPLDLSDANVAAEFRDEPGGSSVVSFVCNVTLPNIVEVQITSDMWADAPDGGAWDLEVVFADGRIRTVLAGDVTVTMDVTHSTATAAPFSVSPSTVATRRPFSFA